jgi:hypothetical protein
MWLPQTIIAQSSNTVQSAPTNTALATTLPKVITPGGSVPTQPENSTLIQVGFTFPLNYAFVVANPLSSAQIFQYLPVGISAGLGVRQDQCIMHSLIPYNTQSQMDFITTLALLYIPTNDVNTLGLDLHTPTAKIYNHEDPSVNTLISYINPSIPLTPGSTLEGSSGTGTDSGSGASSSSSSGNSGVFNTDAQNTSPKVKSTTAGIVVGAAGAAAAYGAAMFFIARRYKKRKLSHRRSNSMMTPSEMRQSGAFTGGGAFMSGGRMTPGNDRNSRGSGRSGGNSARTQQISAPMMAENSLGWNWVCQLS